MYPKAKDLMSNLQASTLRYQIQERSEYFRKLRNRLEELSIDLHDPVRLAAMNAVRALERLEKEIRDVYPARSSYNGFPCTATEKHTIDDQTDRDRAIVREPAE